MRFIKNINKIEGPIGSTLNAGVITPEKGDRVG